MNFKLIFYVIDCVTLVGVGATYYVQFIDRKSRIDKNQIEKRKVKVAAWRIIELFFLINSEEDEVQNFMVTDSISADEHQAQKHFLQSLRDEMPLRIDKFIDVIAEAPISENDYVYLYNLQFTIRDWAEDNDNIKMSLHEMRDRIGDKIDEVKFSV